MIMWKLTGCVAISMQLCAAALAEEPQTINQSTLNRMVAEDPAKAFETAFDAGDELTEADFTAARGVGANVGGGLAFTRIPRADLAGSEEWASHLPKREGGPNATSCISCHSSPIDNGAGSVALNVLVDPQHTGDPRRYLERNTLHLFALGAPQRIAEEMTAELHGQREALRADLCALGGSGTRRLVAKDVDFGILRGSVSLAGQTCKVVFDTARVEGVDDDLVIRPFGWKGTHATIREFARAAAHNELGLQAVELVGDRDGDGDGITHELSVGDLTALAVYMAGLERPTTKIELAGLGLVKLPNEERRAIERGRAAFAKAECGTCHIPEMRIDDPVFHEPSAHAAYREETLPSGIAAELEGLDIRHAVRFDLTADQPNNRIKTPRGEVRLGSFERDADGRAIIQWYSDFKRHDMGPDLADPMDAFGYGASVWPTRSLAGVGSTGPWLHNGHATTLHEAIEAHGGEASVSRDAYLALAENERRDLIAFLRNLVIYKHPEEEEDEEQ